MKKLLTLVFLIVGVYLFLYINNHWIVTTEHVFESEKVPESFDGFRITQVSDLHDAVFGDDQGQLIAKVQATNPDAIFITGDIIDSNRYDLEQSLTAVREFVRIADVYYVIGNHEVASNQINEIYDAMKQIGVKILPNITTTIKRNGETIMITGIEDPLNGHETQWMLDVARLNTSNNTLQILLAHRPEFFKTYVANELDLVFSGHAHGGQVRIPFVGGLVAPGQGLLPTYTAGSYNENATTLFVSRGLGNSTVPFRIFNLPEIVVVELRSK